MNWFRQFWKALTTPVQPKMAGSIEQSDFTPRAVQALTLAREEAARMHHAFVGTEHVLLGLIKLGQGCGINVLCAMGVDLESVRRQVEKQIGPGIHEIVPAHIPFTPRVKKVLALADKERKALKHKYLGTEHIVLGLLREGEGVAGRVLRELRVDINDARRTILKELDPNYVETQAEIPETSDTENPPDTIDLSKRYDVYCREGNEEVVYRNALFRGSDELFHKRAQFIVLELADRKIIFVASSSIVKFSESAGQHRF